jgi:SAM-dependent methyltransferase
VHEDDDPQSFMRVVELHRSILSEFDCALTARSRILDFGCGHGGTVHAYRRAGFDAFGADVKVERPAEWLRTIRAVNGHYRIPFEDGTFDFLYSTSVLEHVNDLGAALSEMHRVLKPGGAGLHLFPPRGRPIEPHVRVPLGGMVQSRAWLLLWALLGVRNTFQKGLGFSRVARSNYAYLHTQTFYRSKGDLRRRLEEHFRTVVFADRQMIKHSYGRARHLSGLVGLFPPLASWYGSLHQYCVFCLR